MNDQLRDWVRGGGGSGEFLHSRTSFAPPFPSMNSDQSEIGNDLRIRIKILKKNTYNIPQIIVSTKFQGEKLEKFKFP